MVRHSTLGRRATFGHGLAPSDGAASRASQAERTWAERVTWMSGRGARRQRARCFIDDTCRDVPVDRARVT
ncbi:hypothetical protein BPC006_II1034 [Burkholderia pseudomallei BPC006]|uniref:Uncharacterized protein n=1 Tax=Burkholderia pseudomallei 1710a TaxID=320371 RepID=A0A0E1VY52_BURPE|nr:hypothetical protein BPC006_II1034 [Burkholderia pseudomallei BPC006]EDS82567.1 hypothetical protein BURPSS13_T0133 [Burkholderia pseudomallei S13]EET05838.1 hypothetical protein BURPS1710A_A0140 [Burkholderia pseudomallei 1710a]